MVEKKRKVWLSSDQVQRMLDLALEQGGERDFLLLSLMRYGLRCGEIVGWRGLPGIRTEDLREEGIWVKGKGYSAGIVQDRLVPLKAELLRRLKLFAPKVGLLFPISEVWAEQITKRYARLAAIQDWQHVSPHRLRAFFATDAKEKGVDSFTIRDLMRHKTISTTNLYVGQSSPEHLKKITETL